VAESDARVEELRVCALEEDQEKFVFLRRDTFFSPSWSLEPWIS